MRGKTNMLTKIKSLQYVISEDGVIEETRVSFHDYNGNPNGNLNLTLTPDDGDLAALSPVQLQELAKQKVLEVLTNEVDE